METKINNYNHQIGKNQILRAKKFKAFCIKISRTTLDLPYRHYHVKHILIYDQNAYAHRLLGSLPPMWCRSKQLIDMGILYSLCTYRMIQCTLGVFLHLSSGMVLSVHARRGER